MEMKTLLSWSSYSLLLSFCGLTLSTCNKNPYGSEFGDLKTGKYDITMYKEYPSGARDTLYNTGYGPEKSFDQTLTFETEVFGSYPSGWGLYYKGYELYYNSGFGVGNMTYKITGIQHTETELQVNFAPFVFPPTPPYDSAYGTVIFKYVE